MPTLRGRVDSARASGWALILLLGGATSLAIAACGSSSGSGQGTPSDAGSDSTSQTCTPGQQTSCACPGSSTTGAQACNATGTGYSACMGCPGEGDSAPSDGSQGDGAPTDAASDNHVGPTHARIIALHGSPDFPALRVCFGLGSTSSVAHLPALPHSLMGQQAFPGVYPGAGGALPDLADFSAQAITVYAIDATKISGDTADAGANEPACDALIGASGQGGTLALGTDYFLIGQVPAGTFADGTTELVALAGCLPQAVDSNASTARCGSSYDPTGGNLALQYYTLDTTSMPGTSSFGLQVVHAASALDGVLSQVGGGVPVAEIFEVIGSDAGAQTTPLGPITFPATNGHEQATPTAAQINTASIFGDLNGNRALVSSVTDAGAVYQFALPLGVVGQLSVGDNPPTKPDGGPYFTAGENYTFVLLGDPTAQQLVGLDGGPNGAYQGYGLHLVAFPNHIAVPAN